MQQPKANSNPIPDTLETIPGYPETLKIYRVPCSSFYQMRCWINGKMITRTTETKNKELAKKAARKFYDDLVVKRAQGQPLTESGQFAAAYKGLLEEDKGRVRLKQIKQSAVDDLEHSYEKDLEPFFKRDQLKNITYTRIQEFVTKLQERELSAKTIKNKLMYLSKILTYAVKNNRLDTLPIFPTIQIEDNPRSWLDDAQYTLLLETLRQEIDNKTVVRYHPITEELMFLTIFLTESFLRPPDIRILENKDITIYRDNPHTYLRIQAKAKVKEKAIVTMPFAVATYEALTEFNTKLGYGKPDDYVFFPGLKGDGTWEGREHAMNIMQKQFAHVLRKADLKTVRGLDVTLYSLRHTAIMRRQLKGETDIFTLAINARTSVEVIQKHYGSHLTPEMMVAEIQSMKKEHQLENLFKDKST